MDFVADGLIGGRRLRCLTIVDDCTRECLAIEVDTSITGVRVQAVLERLADTRALPTSITVDNGPEFDGQVLDTWAYRRNVRQPDPGGIRNRTGEGNRRTLILTRGL